MGALSGYANRALAKRAGVDASGNVGLEATPAVNVKSYGAVGDGVTDDTVAIQNAINAAIAANSNAFVPAGQYYISSHIDIGTIGNTIRSFEFFGAGRGADSASSGTTFVYHGGSIHEIFNVNIWRNGYLHDFAVLCNTQGAATYGILVPDDIPSALKFENITCWYVSRAFGQEHITGSNGEFYEFWSCFGEHVDEFWHNEAGQGFLHSFYGCEADLNKGGTYFNLNLSSGGGGINVFDFNASGDHSGLTIPGGTTNTTLVSATETDAPINFFGGRIEWLTRLLYSPGTSNSLKLTMLFEGLEITLDNDLGNSAGNTLKEFIHDENHFDVITIRNCQVEAVAGTESVNVIDSFTPQPYVIWDRCIFDGLPINPANNPVKNVKYVDCLFSPNANIGVSFLTNAGSWVDGGIDFFNPADAASTITLSNSNLTATVGGSPSGDQLVRGMKLHGGTGKVHLEFTLTARGGSNTSENYAFGICAVGHALTSFLGNANNDSVGFWPSTNSNIYLNNAATAFGAGLIGSTGDVYAIEIDFGASLFWVKNVTTSSNWNGSGTASPATGVGGFSFASIASKGPFILAADMETSGHSITVNPGTSSFALTPSTGFVAW